MPSTTSWYHLADRQRLPMAILRHVLSESDELVNEEITVEVLSRGTALVGMVKSRAGCCPSRITKSVTSWPSAAHVRLRLPRSRPWILMVYVNFRRLFAIKDAAMVGVVVF